MISILVLFKRNNELDNSMKIYMKQMLKLHIKQDADVAVQFWNGITNKSVDYTSSEVAL